MLSFSLFLFLFGLIIGSFLGVIIDRSVHGDSFIYGRSKCPKCRKTIRWYDNIPLISFFLLRGRCRNCGKQISWSYPVIEGMTGALFVWWYVIGAAVFKLSTQPFTILQPAFWLLVGIGFLVVFFADFLYGIIPNGAVYGLTALGIAYRLALTGMSIMRPIDLLFSLLAAMAMTVFFLFLWWITKKRGLGLGDVKFVLPLGLIVGWPAILVAVFLADILGAVTGLLLIAGGKKKFGQTIPFGPFLVLGGVLALLFSDHIVQWYVSLLI